MPKKKHRWTAAINVRLLQANPAHFAGAPEQLLNYAPVSERSSADKYLSLLEACK